MVETRSRSNSIASQSGGTKRKGKGKGKGKERTPQIPEENSQAAYVDDTILKYYGQIGPLIERLTHEGVDKDAVEGEISAIHKLIYDHALQNEIDESIASQLCIRSDDILGKIEPAFEDEEKLENDPGNQEAREHLQGVNEKLKEFEKETGFPVQEFLFEIPDLPEEEPKPKPTSPKPTSPKPTSPKPTSPKPTSPKPTSSNTGFNLFKGYAPGISTSLYAECEPGFTAEGEKILRHLRLFNKEIYTFLVLKETKWGPMLLSKTGKEVGPTARRAYLALPNKIQMNQYYGEMKYGITYTKEFLRDHGTNFLCAGRKDSQTSTGRTLPREYCIVGFKKGEDTWWDVFSKSKYKELNAEADIVFDRWWREHDEPVSTRKPLVGEATSNDRKYATPASTTTHDLKERPSAAPASSRRSRSSSTASSGDIDEVKTELADLRRDMAEMNALVKDLLARLSKK